MPLDGLGWMIVTTVLFAMGVALLCTRKPLELDTPEEEPKPLPMYHWKGDDAPQMTDSQLEDWVSQFMTDTVKWNHYSVSRGHNKKQVEEFIKFIREGREEGRI